MEIQLIPIAQFQSFLVCTVRVAALLTALPVLSGEMVPAKVRVCLILLVSLALFPVLEPFSRGLDFQPLNVALIVCKEALIGILLGLMARFIFIAAQFGGTIVGYQMGFAAANIFDPQNQSQTSLVSQMQNIIAILVFLAIDAHHIFIRAIVESFQILPPGQLDFSGEAIPYLLEMGGSIFVLGAKISAPILAVLLLSGLVLGLMARIFPQLNVFLLSFPVNIGLAFITMSLTLDLTVSLLSAEFNSLSRNILEVFQLFGGS
jgi:flagellar biosynthetic protein FliR